MAVMTAARIAEVAAPVDPTPTAPLRVAVRQPDALRRSTSVKPASRTLGR